MIYRLDGRGVYSERVRKRDGIGLRAPSPEHGGRWRHPRRLLRIRGTGRKILHWAGRRFSRIRNIAQDARPPYFRLNPDDRPWIGCNYRVGGQKRKSLN